MTAKDIIIAIEDYYGMSSNALAIELGVNHTRIDNIVNGVTKSITKSTADLLLKHFPSLNPDFVLKGYEPMLLNKSKDFAILSTSDMISIIMQQYQLGTADLARKLGWKNNVVSSIRIGEQYKRFTSARVHQICKVFPEINPNWLLYGYGEMFLDGRKPDYTLPMPPPVRTNKKVGIESIIEQKIEPPVPMTNNDDELKTINAIILDELKTLRKEIAELREERIGFVAENPSNK